ncbi:Serine/threonine/tyrosine-interacting protein B [Durusdinium trenchii]|uniref:Serine/threonine/tyrosine-interacting protein B n=1 Tax=Durusdinium trenchii TaxID=1381693 RepID=A0ABP0IC33_9DINO
MYDDILLSGSRRFVVAFTRSLPGGRVRYAKMPEGDRRLFSVGCWDGAQKYIAKHEVQGRVQLQRLLNPSALFETDAKGNKVNYLRAEVQLLPEPPLPANDVPSAETWRAELLETWQQLQGLAVSFGEPHLAESFFTEVAPRISSGILAAAWQQLQVQTQMVRKQRRAMEEVRKIMEEGTMSQDEAFAQVLAQSRPTDLDWDFWEQLLPLLAAEPEQRGPMLQELVRDELKLSKARLSLKEALE